jgi:ABC-type Fe3+ transport system permease subunit
MGEVVAIILMIVIIVFSILIASWFSKKQMQSIQGSQNKPVSQEVNKNLNFSVIKTIIIVGSIILLALTNPKETEHKAKLANTFTRSLSKNTNYGDLDSGGLEALGSSLGMALGGSFVKTIMSSLITVDNYVLLSLTKINYKEESRIIGVGILGNVLIFNEATKIIDESTRSAGKKLKSWEDVDW